MSGDLDRLPRTAAFVVSAAYDVLAWNGPASALMEDFTALPHVDLPAPGRRGDRDQRLVLHPAPTGSADAEALALLDVLGAQAGEFLQ